MPEGSIGSRNTMLHKLMYSLRGDVHVHFEIPTCRVFGDLLQWPRRAGAAILKDYISGGASRVLSFDLHSLTFIGCGRHCFCKLGISPRENI
jgi:hypothetical protein